MRVLSKYLRYNICISYTVAISFLTFLCSSHVSLTLVFKGQKLMVVRGIGIIILVMVLNEFTEIHWFDGVVITWLTSSAVTYFTTVTLICSLIF